MQKQSIPLDSIIHPKPNWLREKTKGYLKSKGIWAVMSVWDEYPFDYRAQELRSILAAVRTGECVSLTGLSGSGKSNLLGFLANRQKQFSPSPKFVLLDCNRLETPSPTALFTATLAELENLLLDGRAIDPHSKGVLDSTASAVAGLLNGGKNLCLLFDRFDSLVAAGDAAVYSNLRALRDEFKYRLTFVVATRQPLDPLTELSELFFANTIWLGPLSEADARWNVRRFAGRKSLSWEEPTEEAIVRLAGAYPSLLRAVCEAHAAGAPLEMVSLKKHPIVMRRVDEFWSDHPTPEELRLSGVAANPLITARQPEPLIDAAQLTAKENLLWEYFQAHPDQICEKDELIRAVWPEDRIFERGIRDDSLAQLVRRLREKVESDPSSPEHIQTVPGRGYRFTQTDPGFQY
jgi:hypothetical protein